MQLSLGQVARITTMGTNMFAQLRVLTAQFDAEVGAQSQHQKACACVRAPEMITF